MGGLTLLILIGGFVAWRIYGDPKHTPVSPPPLATPSALTHGWHEVPVITYEETRETVAALRYTWNLSYPVVHLTSHPKEARATNDMIRTFTLDQVDAFRKSAEPEADLPASQDGASDFALRAQTLLASPTHVVFRFDGAEFYSGAAHPNHYTRILTIDMEQGMILDSMNIFSSSSVALPWLSDTARSVLKDRFLDDGDTYTHMTLPGTMPVEQNFRTIGLRADGIVLIFDPYHVAPYARGPQEVFIPTAEVEALLHPRILKAMRDAETQIVHATMDISNTP